MIEMPHSQQAEQEVLGGLIKDECRSLKSLETLERLKADDFHIPPHSAIFDVISKKANEGTAVDPVAIAERLPDYKAYIVDLYANSIGSNIEFYASVVKEKSKERRLIRMMREALDVLSTNTPHQEKIEAVGKLIDFEDAEESCFLIDSRDMAANFVSEIDARFNSEESIIGLTTGLEKLDDMLGGIRGGQLITIGGGTKMGKTTLAINFCQAALEQGKCGLFFSMEMAEQELFERRVSYEGRLDSNQLRLGLKNSKDPGDWTKLNHGVSVVKGQPLYVDQSPALHINQIKTRARIAKRKHDIDFIVVDYIGLAKGDGDREDIKIGSITKGLKEIAKDLDVPVIALAQLKKGEQTQRPTIDDLYGSGAISQDSDAVLLIYRDEAVNEQSQLKGIAEIIVAVQRSGGTGTVPVASNMSCFRFDNPDQSVYQTYSNARSAEANKPKKRGF